MNKTARRPNIQTLHAKENIRMGFRILESKARMDPRFSALRKDAHMAFITVYSMEGKRLGPALLLRKEGGEYIVADGGLETGGNSLIMSDNTGRRFLVTLAGRPSKLASAFGINEPDKTVVIGEGYAYTSVRIESSFSIVDEEEARKESLRIKKPVTVRMANGEEKVLSMAQLLGTEGWKMVEFRVMGREAVMLMGEDRNVLGIRGSGSMAALVDTDHSLFMLKNMPSGKHFAITLEGKWYDAVPASHRLANIVLNKYAPRSG